MTAQQSLLAVLADLEEAGGAAGVPLPVLVVAAWRADPARFGLPRFRGEYPDSNRVNVELTKRLVGEGLARRTEPGHVRLTAAGWAAVRRLRKGVTA